MTATETTDVIEVPRGPQTSQERLAAAALRWRGRARAVAIWSVQAAARWRLHAALPGLLGAAMVACGIGGLVGAWLGPDFGPWAGVLAGGVFLLRIDARVGGG
jgi:hypothetical protein